jgi:hypothetical protein
MQPEPARYSIVGRLMWLPVFSAPFAATVRRIFLPAAVVGVVTGILRDPRAGVEAGLTVWFVACWIFSFTYGRSSSESVRFWRVVVTYPEAAYQWFTIEDSWHVVSDASQGSPPSGDWTGPFRLYVPSLGRWIRIYGRHPDLEQSQERFLARARQDTGRNL